MNEETICHKCNIPFSKANQRKWCNCELCEKCIDYALENWFDTPISDEEWMSASLIDVAFQRLIIDDRDFFWILLQDHIGNKGRCAYYWKVNRHIFSDQYGTVSNTPFRIVRLLPENYLYFLNRSPQYISCFRETLTFFRAIKKIPKVLGNSNKDISYKMQKFIFKFVDCNHKVWMVKGSDSDYGNMCSDYIKSLEFKKDWEHWILANKIGFFDD